MRPDKARPCRDHVRGIRGRGDLVQEPAHVGRRRSRRGVSFARLLRPLVHSTDCRFIPCSHRIKNSESQASIALQGVKSRMRLILTGTPLQNNLQELWALLHFLYPAVFPANTLKIFRDSFNLSAGLYDADFLNKAQKLLGEVIMLRRTKEGVSSELSVPPREELTRTSGPICLLTPLPVADARPPPHAQSTSPSRRSSASGTSASSRAPTSAPSASSLATRAPLTLRRSSSRGSRRPKPRARRRARRWRASLASRRRSRHARAARRLPRGTMPRGTSRRWRRCARWSRRRSRAGRTAERTRSSCSS